MAAVRARRSLAELDGWLPASGVGHLRVGCGDGAAVRAATRARWRARVALADEIAFDLQKASPRLPKQGIPDGHTPRLAGCGSSPSAASPSGTPAHRSRRGPRAGRARAAGDRREGLRRLLRHRPRHRRVRAEPGHPLPGQGIGGQLGGLLRARRSPRSTRSSTGCRSSGSSPSTATRSPTSTSTSTPTGARRSSSGSTRRYGRHNAAQVANVVSYRPQDGGPRRRQGARPLAGPAGRVVQAGRRAGRRSRSTAEHGRIPRPVVELANELLSARRGTSASTPAAWCSPSGRSARWCPIERARMERPHRPPVGQGRLRVHGAGQVRPARSRHARRARPHDADCRGAPRRALGAGDDPQGGAGGLRHALPRRLDRGVPGREPRPDRHPAAAQAAQLLRPGDRDRADPARADPGRRRPPLHPPRHRQGAGHLRPPVSRAGARSAPSVSRSSRSS